VSLSDTSHPPAPLTLVTPSPLVAPLCCTPLIVHSGWLSCCLLSRCRLPSACASISDCTAASHLVPLAPLVRLIVASTLVTLLPFVHLRLCLSLHCCLSPRPFYASCPAGCHVTSCYTATSRPPAPPPLITPISRLLSGWLLRHLSSRHHHLPLPAPPLLIVLPPLIAPLSCLFFGWLSCNLLSRRCLPSAWASAFHCTAASHCTPLAPHVRLIVALTLVTPLPSDHLHLRLSSHRRLSLHPSCASFPAGCHVTTRHAAAPHPPALRLSLHRHLSLCPSCASCPSDCCIDCHATAFQPPAPLPLIALPPHIAPLLRLFSGWLLHHLLSCHRLPSACTSASHCTAASHCAPLVPLVRLIVALTLVMPLPSNHLHLCLSSHHRLSLHPSCASFLAGCCVSSCHATASCPPALHLSLHCCLSPHPTHASCLTGCCVTSHHASASHQPVLLPLSALPPLIVPLLRSCVRCRWQRQWPRQQPRQRLR
jgi:hypothetical protein